ncbi:MAG: carbon monoxide dehydrogenase [Spirochaetes bacterium]|nr:MAG: carbon monoxide dehydrogenase [Spirochaetota bacterium]
MGFSIAITGKGGTGKTTLAGLIVSSLVKAEKVPVLAVDADPNSCLDGVLGVESCASVGGVREEARDESAKGALAGIARRDWLELKIAECLVEAEGFDLIAMGRPEGPGCYCYANNVLRDVIAAIAKNYPFMVIDNEAGLENLSRRIVQRVDLLIMVADASRRGIETLARLYELAREMKIEFGKSAAMINRMRGARLPDESRALLSRIPLDTVLYLPENDDLARWGEEGRSLFELPGDNAVVRELRAYLLDHVISGAR